jgi:hypothetical protein
MFPNLQDANWLPFVFSSELNSRRIPEEKGPFGKSMRRRGTSRSKTVTPARKEDQAKVDNAKYIDDIFGNYKASLKTQEPAASTTAGLDAAAPASTSQGPTIGEPTEVIIYGFGQDLQWSAIEFYERVSSGMIYEDYDRHPPHSKYNLSLSLSRASAQRNLSQAALRKKNQYVGGDHWIKVTFDSPEAAELACYNSPHVLQGHLVYAERYRGVGPKEDTAILASPTGITSLTTSPTIRSSTVQGANTGSPTASITASSATATVSLAPTVGSTLPVPGSLPYTDVSIAAPSDTAVATSNAFAHRKSGSGTLRIRGAKRAVLLPAEEAFMPVAPRWQRTIGSIPLISAIFGAGSGIIGNQVPRKEDGAFDWDNASVYWRLWYWIDSMLGTDFCGIKGDD